jgi:hypothetical protein
LPPLRRSRTYFRLFPETFFLTITNYMIIWKKPEFFPLCLVASQLLP